MRREREEGGKRKSVHQERERECRRLSEIKMSGLYRGGRWGKGSPAHGLESSGLGQGMPGRD